ncbi:WYL domain-containing protein [Streptomyces atratus]|uniref:WYL domain-containing protein n=1 Tax=Streptomyces atratus TaxID=1893 RepID=A0A1K2F9W2_STRAR|nr:WYL domain-containing protein [Streptomyces atratus]
MLLACGAAYFLTTNLAGLRADADPGADLLGEDLVPWDAGSGECVELRLEFLGEAGAPRVPDADVRSRGVEAGFNYPSGSEVRRRRAEPYRLVASDRRWYLLAYDLDRDDWRSFRADRMTEVVARTWRFRPRPAPDAATYVQEGVASRVYPHRARFLVHASADTVRAQLPASAAVVRRRESELCEVLSGAASLDAVLMHVLLLGHDFEILDPPELGSRCRALAERLLAAGATVSSAPDMQES